MTIEQAINHLQEADPWKFLPSVECDPNPSDAFDQGYRIAIEYLKDLQDV